MIVIGGGAAGFFTAINAARLNPSMEVILLEKTGKLLSKVKVSGGGRCNVTHACFDISEMIRHYPRGAQFLRKAFHQFFTTDTIEWFESRSVRLKQEADGRMFPATDQSQTIIDCLMREANRYGVSILMNREVKKVEFRDERYHLMCANGEIMVADVLCVAGGGFPKASQFEWLTQLGHSISKPVPSLFTFNLPAHPITRLMGVVAEPARIRISGTKLEQEGPVLITHWGLSGPAVLKLSAWAARELADRQWTFEAIINWTPQYHENNLRDRLRIWREEKASQKVYAKNELGLPARLWEFLLDSSGIQADTRWADLPARLANLLIQQITRYSVDVKGKTTFKEEFVTAGGINLSEIDPQTMMSKKLPNLYFAGEILDVDGVTGGFNFQNAWTTGFIAAKNIAKLAE